MYEFLVIFCLGTGFGASIMAVCVFWTIGHEPSKLRSADERR